MNRKMYLYREIYYQKYKENLKGCYDCVVKKSNVRSLKKTIYKVSSQRPRLNWRCRDCEKLFEREIASKEEIESMKETLKKFNVDITKLRDIVMVERENNPNEERLLMINNENTVKKRGTLPTIEEEPTFSSAFSQEELIKILEDAKLEFPTEEEAYQIVKNLEKYNEILEEEQRTLTSLEEEGKTFEYFRKEENRLMSFQNWPLDHITPLELASAGFYFTGKDDAVKCFSCEMILKQCMPGDRAFQEHAKWSSKCYMVNGKACGNVKIERGEDTCARYTEEKAREKEIVKSGQECLICTIRKRNQVFLPCGHSIACKQCADALEKCAYCRREITEKLTIFFV